MLIAAYLLTAQVLTFAIPIGVFAAVVLIGFFGRRPAR
jgi:hypothetical protein